ncbi:MAG: alpha/beta hydrolase [Pseudomonadota bacterium]
MKALLVTVFVFATVVVLALYAGQRKLMFPAPIAPLPADLGQDVEFVSLDAGYGLLALPRMRQASMPLLIFAHGNAEVAHWSIDSFDYFRARGIAVLLLEYPGYAGAGGKPSATSMVASAVSAMDYAVARDDIDGDSVVIYGRSIGGGVAAQLAANRQSVALVLESSFTSLAEVVTQLGFPAFLLRDQFDTATVVADLEIPVLLYHGIEDQIIGIQHSEKLAALAQNATLLKADCGHNDCPRPWQAMMQFMRSAGIRDVDTDVAALR